MEMNGRGPLPPTNRRNRYRLIIIDYFTKWPEVYPIRNMETRKIADICVREFISRSGIPRQVINTTPTESNKTNLLTNINIGSRSITNKDCQGYDFMDSSYLSGEEWNDPDWVPQEDGERDEGRKSI
ncbi:hypothetical protein RF11_00291 [Thelohanellus kitauei]|uniref:Integrase catalytic domain-containing protein n=1 Tax=Thelohanellus kitauei TaxID=669202 RepID=A0A0C2IK47_THEKT|nr:hypothetical protein RF11_00291 [Thelohanellus kitauei]